MKSYCRFEYTVSICQLSLRAGQYLPQVSWHAHLLSQNSVDSTPDLTCNVPSLKQHDRAGIWELPRAMRKAGSRAKKCFTVKWQSHPPTATRLAMGPDKCTCTLKYKPFNDLLNKLLSSMTCFSYLGMVAAILDVGPCLHRWYRW